MFAYCSDYDCLSAYGGQLCLVSLSVTRNGAETRINFVPVLYDMKPPTTNWVLSYTNVFYTQTKIVISVLFSFVILFVEKISINEVIRKTIENVH